MWALGSTFSNKNKRSKSFQTELKTDWHRSMLIERWITNFLAIPFLLAKRRSWHVCMSHLLYSNFLISKYRQLTWLRILTNCRRTHILRFLEKKTRSHFCIDARTAYSDRGNVSRLRTTHHLLFDADTEVHFILTILSGICPVEVTCFDWVLGP